MGSAPIVLDKTASVSVLLVDILAVFGGVTGLTRQFDIGT
jgi:hypothetical protein